MKVKQFLLAGIVFAAVLGGALVFTAYSLSRSIHNNSDTVNRESYQRCLDRNVNVAKQNDFYRAMAKLEATNKFIDQKLRDERVTLYTGLVLAQPNCGPRP